MSKREESKSINTEVVAPSLVVDEDEIDLLELLNVLWAGRKIVVIVTSVFAVLSVIYALTRTDIYRAEAVLAPAQARQSGSPLAAQLGGAAALVGINVNQSAGGQIPTAIAILQSREFITKFIADHNLLPYLFVAEWDSGAGRSIIDSSIYDENTQSWKDAGAIPSDSQAYRLFSGVFEISNESATGLIRVSIDWPDPVLASRWTNLAVADINRYVKERDLDEARNAIIFLQEQLESTQLVEMQRVFYQLIESQTRVIMLADVRDEYVFQVIDPAVVPDQIEAPNRRLISIVGTLLGFFASMVLVFGRHIVLDVKALKRLNFREGKHQ